jgi:hypothetical protein
MVLRGRRVVEWVRGPEVGTPMIQAERRFQAFFGNAYILVTFLKLF